MSLLFEVQSSIKNYGVHLFPHDTQIQKSARTTRVCIFDSKVRTAIPLSDYDVVIPVEAEEKNKTLTEVGRIIVELQKNAINRTDKVDVIGGGILQDVGTLSASLFLRGIEWNYFPTTFLSMVDSCIGGKSSINHQGYKNIIGNFFPPNAVFIYPAFCETLDQDKILEGTFEAVKILFASGKITKRAIATIINKDNLSSPLVISQIIKASLFAKKYFIEVDEFDQGPRLKLNFGHTFGHAIEASSEYRIPHGIAVGLGMLMAFQLVIELTPNYKATFRQLELIKYLKELMNSWPKKDLIGNWLDARTALEAFDRDKKHLSTKYRLILPNETNQLEVSEIQKNNETKSQLLDAFLNIGKHL